MDRKQSIRLKNTLLAAVGGVLLTAGVLYAHLRDLTLISNSWLIIFISIFWTVNLSIILSIIFGYNTRFRDPSMSLFQMYWASLSAILALALTHYIDTFFYLLILLPMVFGVFRVAIKQFQSYTVVVIIFLLIAIIYRSYGDGESLDLINNFAIWLSFSFCAFTLSILCKSVIRLQDRLRNKNEQLEHALEARAYFLANMSHEIRTPMNGVLGMLDISLREEISEKVRHDLLIAKESSKALLSIINDILDFSKIEAGKLELNPVTFDLKQLLKGLLSPFEAITSKNGINLELVYDESTPNYISMDSNRLRQILNNLIGNAIKFTHKGTIQLTVLSSSGSLQGQSQATLTFLVSDTGIGIQQDKLDSLFEHFTQADVTTTRQYGGTGLGLAITKNLCQLMNGNIFVCSEEGKGTTFKFTIDVDLASFEDIPKTHKVDTTSHSNARILLVEDNITNQEVAKITLEDLGAKVKVANHGKEALALLSESGAAHPVYDLIFMDCQMPQLDGYETTQIIRSEGKFLPYAEIPIIAMTANAMQGDREKCIASGMSDYTTKPIDISRILSMLNKWITSEQEANSISKPKINIESPYTEALELQLEVWNQKKLLKMVGNKPERVVKLITTFAESFDHLVEAIIEAIESQNIKELKQLIHDLRGAATNLQFECLADICMQIEAQITAQNFDIIPELAKTFEKEARKAKVHAWDG